MEVAEVRQGKSLQLQRESIDREVTLSDLKPMRLNPPGVQSRGQRSAYRKSQTRLEDLPPGSHRGAASLSRSLDKFLGRRLTSSSRSRRRRRERLRGQGAEPARPAHEIAVGPDDVFVESIVGEGPRHIDVMIEDPLATGTSNQHDRGGQEPLVVERQEELAKKYENKKLGNNEVVP